MPYFDLHCHPFLRTTWIDAHEPDTDFFVKINPGNANLIQKLVIRAFGKPLETILNSQSSLSAVQQADPTGAKIIVATLLALENSYANLTFCGFKQVLQFVDGIKLEQLKEIGDSTYPYPISYHSLLDRELSFVNNFGAFRCQVVSNFSQIITDSQVIKTILNMAGGYNFYTNSNVLAQETQANRGQVAQQLEIWKKAAFRNERPRLLYTTVTHHTANCLANHAFGGPGRFAENGTNPSAGGFNPIVNRIEFPLKNRPNPVFLAPNYSDSAIK